MAVCPVILEVVDIYLFILNGMRHFYIVLILSGVYVPDENFTVCSKMISTIFLPAAC